ncbi:acyltransferase [Candidatus Saccharibacteria bacterium]|nr:acyltransferase [Candidatus Saccharibacteria bacterium]
MKTTTKKSRPFNYLTVASVLSALSVIFMHNSSFYAYAPNIRWYATVIIQSICCCAVPVFFMISGATLIDYRDRYDTKTFLKKRFKKTFIPFLFWSIIGIFIHLLYLKDFPDERYTPYNLIQGIFSATFIPFFWFFAHLFALYLAIPVISCINKSKRRVVFRYCIFLTLILNYLVPIIAKHNLPTITFNFVLTAESAIYFALVGYYIYNYDIKKRTRIAIYALGIIAILATILGTYFFSHREGTLVAFLSGSTSDISYAIFAPAVFLFIKNFFAKHQPSANSKFAKLTTFFSNYTFASYLTHYLPIALLSIPLGNSHTQWYYPLIAIPSCIVFAIISKIIFSKIPLLRHVLPD